MRVQRTVVEAVHEATEQIIERRGPFGSEAQAKRVRRNMINEYDQERFYIRLVEPQAYERRGNTR